MMNNLIELVVASIILVAGLGIVFVIWGGDPELATSLIHGFTELAVYILVIGVLVAISVGLLRSANR